jgi:feruloyl esterase
MPRVIEFADNALHQRDSMPPFLIRLLPVLAAFLLAACAQVPAAKPPLATPLALQQCEALAGMRVPAAGIGLPLSNWNGRALQSGGGGLGGVVMTAPGNKASGRFDPNPLNVPYPITQGYVTFGSDQGHPRAGSTRAQGGDDLAFTRNEEAMRNWAFEESKKTRDAAMAVIQAAYGRRPTHVFFSGESAGGREALRAAQKFPDDYDGVIATSPVISWYGIHLFDNTVRDRLVDGGMLDARAVKLVADRTRASCDEADGLKDGVVAKYLECANDVAQLQCTPGQAPGSCLTPAQVAAVNALREPRVMPIPFANGVRRMPGFGVTGDEDGAGWQWAFYPIGTEAPSRPLPPGLGFEPRRGAVLNFGAFLIRHTVVGRPDFDPYGFDPRPHADRILQLSNLFDATDPDLSRFAARGGKLIVVHPSADNASPLTLAAEYYGSVVASLGQQRTDGFMRLYVPAGGSHNVGGPSQVNALAMLEDWVLRGVTPPDAPAATELALDDMRFIRSMPACRFPAYPRYAGGDPKVASSFTCVARPQMKFVQQ